MNIRMAILRDKKARCGITRRAWKESKLFIIPTNGAPGMIIGQMGRLDYSPGWEPDADDLQATDWYCLGTSTQLREKINGRFDAILKSVLHSGDGHVG